MINHSLKVLTTYWLSCETAATVVDSIQAQSKATWELRGEWLHISKHV